MKKKELTERKIVLKGMVWTKEKMWTRKKSFWFVYGSIYFKDELDRKRERVGEMERSRESFFVFCWIRKNWKKWGGKLDVGLDEDEFGYVGMILTKSRERERERERDR